jgi:putative membrane protein
MSRLRIFPIRRPGIRRGATGPGGELIPARGHCRSMKTQSSLSSLRWALIGAAGLGSLLATGALSAQVRRDDPPPPIVRDKVELKNADKNFAEKAAKASMEEVEVSRVAAARSSNPEVRAFAEQMAADHARMADELAALAAVKGISLPARDRIATKWEKQNAKDFDHDYLKKMVSDHEATVKLFQKQANDGNDPDLVAFARKHLSDVQHHLQRAKDLERFLK